MIMLIIMALRMVMITMQDDEDSDHDYVFFRPQAKARHSSGGKDPFKVSRIKNAI